jgi:hypothetical protein
MSEMALLGLIVALHLVALTGGAVLAFPLLRADDGRDDAASNGPPAHEDRPTPPPRPIGPPLLDARHDLIRVREPDRLPDRRPIRARRPAREQSDRRRTRRVRQEGRS